MIWGIGVDSSCRGRPVLEIRVCVRRRVFAAGRCLMCFVKSDGSVLGLEWGRRQEIPRARTTQVIFYYEKSTAAVLPLAATLPTLVQMLYI